jgi:hypothetical protein
MIVQFVVIANGLKHAVGEQVVAEDGLPALQDTGRRHFANYRNYYEEIYGKGLSFQARWLDSPARNVKQTIWINI